MDIPQNPNPNHSSGTDINLPDFELSDYLIFEDGLEEEFSPPDVVVSPVNVTGGSFESGGSNPINSNIECENGAKQNKVAMDAGSRIAIRMKSQMEILDDGFKWRKYGKKMVKNNPNPRNYFKCSSGGCNVKKRVERDSEDPSYVITTYAGVHNHESPSVVYYDQTPLLIPHGWTLHASTSRSHSHSSSSSSSSNLTNVNDNVN